eukprot:COSAG06_NODE_29108_length_562_cov_1.291577_2_plen_28_part_01
MIQSNESEHKSVRLHLQPSTGRVAELTA